VIPPKPRGPHPDAEALYRAQASPGSEGSAEVLAHSATCADCSAELAALEQFDARPPDLFGAEARRTRGAWAKFIGAPEPRRSTFGLVPALVTAAAVCLAVALVVFLPRRETDVLRGGEASARAFSPSGEIPAPPAEFRFPSSGDASVRVSVFDAERFYAWTSAPSAPGVPVAFPETERAKLRPGTTYTWIVLGGGEALPAHTFTLRR
jgi:hypothetical protein